MVFKKPKLEQVEKLKTPVLTDESCPAFTFKYIVNDTKYNLESSKATQQLKCKLLHSIHNYSQITWNNFIGDKKQTGVEIVGLSKLRKLKVKLPDTPFYNGVKNVNIFRVSNNSARIVGWRARNICYVLWIDWDFTSYDHG